MSKAKWPDAPNKWGLEPDGRDGVQTNNDLLRRVETSLKDHRLVVNAFNWSRSPEKFKFWSAYRTHGTKEGRLRLMQMKHELIESKPFNKEDLI